jgi:hypothetical protein
MVLPDLRVCVKAFSGRDVGGGYEKARPRSCFFSWSSAPRGSSDPASICKRIKAIRISALVVAVSPGYPRQGDPRMTLQKLLQAKCRSLSASTSILTLPKVVSCLCLMPFEKAWMMSSFKCDADVNAPPPRAQRRCTRHSLARAHPFRRRPSLELRPGASAVECRRRV